jgi:signal transduction histidine kinase
MKKIIRIIGGQGLVLAIVAVIIIFSSYWAVSNVSAQRNEDVVKSLEEALQRASVQCYALEGAYPPDLEYLSENYGIILDEETYFYLYDLQGSNIPPNISVIER